MQTDMKCLSISQPFADLVVSGKKTIEIRTWNTKFRGDFLIHAPIKVRTDDLKRLGISGTPVTGAIIGRAELVDVRIYATASQFDADYGMHFASGDYRNAQYGFMLSNARRFEKPVPYKGKLGFFTATIPDTRIDEQVRADIINDLVDENHRYKWVNRH